MTCKLLALTFIRLLSRPGPEPWLKISWTSNNQPDLAILKYGTCLSLAYLGEIWPLLVLDNWKVITNFLVKAVMQDLLFSGVTAFNSLSADFESRLMPRSGVLPLLVCDRSLAERPFQVPFLAADWVEAPRCAAAVRTLIDWYVAAVAKRAATTPLWRRYLGLVAVLCGCHRSRMAARPARKPSESPITARPIRESCRPPFFYIHVSHFEICRILRTQKVLGFLSFWKFVV